MSESVIRVGEVRVFNGKCWQVKYWFGNFSVICVEVEQRGALGDWCDVDKFGKRFTMNEWETLKVVG